MNFRVVEGGDSPEFIDKFIRLYNNLDLRASDVARELDISQSKYRRIKKNLIEGGLIDKNLRRVKATYVSHDKSNSKFIVQKRVNGVVVQFTRYPDKERALCAAGLYRKYGWDKNNTRKIRKEVERMWANEGTEIRY